MVSVRIAAAGAVVVATLSFLTAPVSACDDRYVKRCEKASAAEAAAAEARSTAPVAKRNGRHVRVVSSRRSRHIRFVARTRAPGFAMKRHHGMVLASDSTRMTTLMPESALARRFQGFIGPQPMAQNAFEPLRKPHLAALNLEPAITLPAAEQNAAAPSPPVQAASEEAAPALAAPKQGKLSAENAEPTLTKPVALTDALTPKSVPQVEAAVTSMPVSPEPQATTPQAVLSEAPPAAPEPPKGFPIHGLVLALCGALGAASALRFFVGV